MGLHLLVVSSCLFLVKVDFFRACHWPAWWACCFLEVGFFRWASSLLVVSSCHVFFVKVDFVQGLSLACLVVLLLFLKWDFRLWASSLLVVCGRHFLCS